MQIHVWSRDQESGVRSQESEVRSQKSGVVAFPQTFATSLILLPPLLATVYTHLWVRCEMRLDPPKSPLKRGTLIKFSPLFKGGWGGSKGVESRRKIGIRTRAIASYLCAFWYRNLSGCVWIKNSIFPVLPLDKRRQASLVKLGAPRLIGWVGLLLVGLL